MRNIYITLQYSFILCSQFTNFNRTISYHQLRLLQCIQSFLVTLPLLAGLHRLEMFVKFRLMGAKGKVEYVPLSDEKAAEVGAEMLGEAFLYSVAASYMLYEYYKSIKKGIEKETNTSDNISDLQEQIATLANRVEQLALTVDNKLEQLPSDKSKK